MSEATAVRERPILFSGRLVRAILDDRKTVTRRVIRPQPAPYRGGWAWRPKDRVEAVFNADARATLDEMARVFCPYGAPGDRLWVRETFSQREGERIVAYRADGECGAWLGAGSDRMWNRHGYVIEVETNRGPSWGLAKYGGRWRPSIHMPRWASRISLEVTEVRVERLQDITEEDARAEGANAADAAIIFQAQQDGGVRLARGMENTARGAFCCLWDSLNAARGYGWDANPWVWRIAFRRVT